MYIVFLRSLSYRYLALTKFEATEARKAFPCFDEPNKKASYTMRMTRAKDLTSTLFNTPRESSEESKVTSSYDTITSLT